jgi:hypothetical protein
MPGEDCQTKNMHGKLTTKEFPAHLRNQSTICIRKP